MKEKHIILTELLSAALRNKAPNFEKYKGMTIDWQEIFNEARTHQVHSLIYPVVNEINAEVGVEKEIMEAWKQSVLTCGFQMICNQLWIGEVIEILNSFEIKTIVLKGMVVSKWYPHPELRTMGDADILVMEKDLKKTTQLLHGMGYISQKDRKTKHIEFYKKDYIAIELHRLLADCSFIKNADLLNNDAWSEPMEIELGNTKTLALSWEMQIIYCCIHMASHISNQGIGLRQLCDLVVIVEKGSDNINWNIVHDKSIKYGIDQFVSAIFTVCHRLFNLEVPFVFSDCTLSDTSNIDLLIKDILDGGNFGRRDIRRVSANVLVNNAKAGESQKYSNKLINALHLLFPSRSRMLGKYKYIYVKKSPLLLPAAWIHRIVFGIIRRDLKFEHKKAIFQDNSLIDMANKRNNLLEWLKLR
mgnify:CR=1 FL=1